MKKYFLQTILLFASVAAFAQDDEQHSAAYNFGEKYAIEIILGVIVLIVLIILAIRRKKNPPPPPPPQQ
jgi:putative copper export protein